jgi:hypothetical protein
MQRMRESMFADEQIAYALGQTAGRLTQIQPSFLASSRFSGGNARPLMKSSPASTQTTASNASKSLDSGVRGSSEEPGRPRSRRNQTGLFLALRKMFFHPASRWKRLRTLAATPTTTW